MYKWDIVMWSCIIIMTYVLVFGLQQIFAFDYMEDAAGGIWDKSPTICFNVPKDQKWLSLRAMDSWEENWKNHIGNSNFNYHLSDISKNMKKFCDVQIINTKPSSVYPDSKAIGVTACSTNDNGYFSKCHIFMSFEHFEYYNTIVHELGHGFGLGHRKPLDLDGMLGVLQENDIMFPISNSFHKITKVDLDALKFYYGENGFEKDDIVYKHLNYTVPHD